MGQLEKESNFTNYLIRRISFVNTPRMDKKRERDEIQPTDVAQPVCKKPKLSSPEEAYEKALNDGIKVAKETVEGLDVIRHFLSEEEQDNLISDIDKNPWSSELKRRVQHYGYKYDYKSKALDESSKIGDLPKFCEPLIERMLKQGLINEKPDQLIINGNSTTNLLFLRFSNYFFCRIYPGSRYKPSCRQNRYFR